ncbi:TPA: phage tail tape measure protein [Vibrio vulnificus]|nr:phage tail tape measure protein [Vibrio vulnificus]HDY8191311.1 phage tail tape measure protein [Vibrio vulnificus]
MAIKSLGQLTVDLVLKTGSFTEGVGRAERANERLEKGLKKQREELARLVGQIDPVVAEYARIDKMEQKLRKNRERGLLSGDEFDRYLGKLNEMRKSVGQTSVEFDKNGMSAKQMQAALRGVPAQFTDIAVSLQGGQNPLTVFLQQGGQLKDMFGGIGPAAKAMGGYIAGLVNPFSVAAASAAALALAYYQGSEEADRYRNAIILTGNASGVTSDQLNDMAKRIDEVSGTQRNAAKAIAEIATSGKFASTEIESVAKAAIMMESATGKAVSETIEEFVKLAQEPSKAIAELNKNQNFLTQSIYEQIVALEKQGKTQDAVTLAVRTYSDTITERTSEITENLGYIESAWKSLKNGASEAWDAMLSVGRADTDSDILSSLNEQIDEAEKKLKSAQAMLASGISSTGYGTGKVDYSQQEKAAKKALDSLIKERDAIAEKVKIQEDEAKKKAEINKLEQDAIQASEAINKVKEGGLSIDEKREKAVKAYLDNIEKIRKANPESKLLDPQAIEKDLERIREQFKEPEKRAKAYVDGAGLQMLMRLKEQEAALREQVSTGVKLGASQKELVKFEQQIADIKEKGTLTAQQKSLLAEEDAIREQLKKNVAIESELALREQVVRIQNMQSSAAAQLANDVQKYEQSLAAFGGDEEKLSRLREEEAVRADIAKQIERATAQNLAGKISNEELDAQKAILQQSLEDRLQAQRDYYAKVDELEADWTVGSKAAFESYIREANRTAKQSEKFFTSAFAAMENSIYQFAMTGKLSFKDFASSIIADMARIAAQKAAAGLIEMGVSIFASAYGGSAASTGYNAGFTGGYDSIGFSSGGYTGAGGKYEPAGIVHKGEVVWSQEDVARAGGVGIVEMLRNGLIGYREGLKGYASGGVVGGMPEISNASGEASIVIHQEINANTQQSGEASQDQQAIAKAYADSAKLGAKEQIMRELQPGGLIWRAQNSR